MKCPQGAKEYGTSKELKKDAMLNERTELGLQASLDYTQGLDK